MTPLEAAIDLTRRGCSVLPIPDRSKKPELTGWQRLRLKESDLAAHFNRQPRNIGVLLGEPSDWQIDVDLDHPRCVELADQFLPHTPAVFGRPGKPRSHRIYRVTAPVATKKHKSKSVGMLVELRSTGAQTVFPPSTHESGEPITWDVDGAEPALVDPQPLLESIARLADVVRVELGEKAAPKPVRTPPRSRTHQAGSLADRLRACVAVMLKLGMQDNHDGSARLFAAACRVVEHDLSDADGIIAIREYARQRPFPTEWTDVQILARIRDAEKKVQRTAPGSRPTIITTDVQLQVLTEQAIAALKRANDPSCLFVRSGSLVRISQDENSVPIIERLDRTHVRCRLAAVGEFYTVRRSGDAVHQVSVPPPTHLSENILALGEWPFPSLFGLARAPIVRPNGTLCVTPGYDRETCLFYVPDPGLQLPEIPEYPSIHEVHACADILSSLIDEFPFVDQSSRANALAVLFSILLRAVIKGHIPLALFDAPSPGTGKTLLATILLSIAIGVVSTEAIPSKQNEDEWRKKITTVLLSSIPVVLLDNFPQDTIIDSPLLSAVLTSHEWSDRRLGHSEGIRAPAKSIWIATGNNLQVAGDLPRRCYVIRLDSELERPWERTGFKISDIEAHVRANRGDLLSAALTIIRGWFAAGCPRCKMPPFGSFDECASVVGSVLAYADIEGFLGNLDQTQSRQGKDNRQWKVVFTAWWNHFGDKAVTVAEVFNELLCADAPHRVEVPESLLVAKDRGEGSLKISLGKQLPGLDGRVFDGRKLCDCGEHPHQKVRCWALKPSTRHGGESENHATPAT